MSLQDTLLADFMRGPRHIGTGGTTNAQSNTWYDRCEQTIFQNVPDSPDTGWRNGQLRQLIPASAIIQPKRASTWLDITLEYAATAVGAVIGGAFVGHQALAGDPWNFDGGQVQQLFSGAAVSPAITGASQLSPDTVHFEYQPGRALLFSFYWQDVGTVETAYNTLTAPGTLGTTFWMTSFDAGFNDPGATTLPFMNTVPASCDFVFRVKASS